MRFEATLLGHLLSSDQNWLLVVHRIRFLLFFVGYGVIQAGLRSFSSLEKTGKHCAFKDAAEVRKAVGSKTTNSRARKPHTNAHLISTCPSGTPAAKMAPSPSCQDTRGAPRWAAPGLWSSSNRSWFWAEAAERRDRSGRCPRSAPCSEGQPPPPARRKTRTQHSLQIKASQSNKETAHFF